MNDSDFTARDIQSSDGEISIKSGRETCHHLPTSKTNDKDEKKKSPKTGEEGDKRGDAMQYVSLVKCDRFQEKAYSELQPHQKYFSIDGHAHD